MRNPTDWPAAKAQLKRGQLTLAHALQDPACEGRLAIEVLSMSLLARSDHQTDDLSSRAAAILADADIPYGISCSSLEQHDALLIAAMARSQHASAPAP